MLTIAASLWPRKLDEQRYPVTARLYRPEADTQVLIHSQSPENPLGDVVLVHGLEGSSDAGYMRSMAQALLEAGFATHRLNTRTCGGTEFLSPTLYHAGLTTDLFAWVMELDRQRRTPVYVVGFSLGGNMALKLAGELGEDGRRLLAGVCTVSTPLDLAACARRLGEWQNRIYQWRFVASMKKRLRIRKGILPDKLAWDRLNQVGSVYEFDDIFTGPSFGFNGAEHYYRTQSAAGYLDAIRVPTLLVHATDDPMIPPETYRQRAFGSNGSLRLVTVAHGGHIGFLSRDQPRIWVDGVVVDWLMSSQKPK